MTVEKGLRATSPVHVHVEDDVPVHVHVKQPKKKSAKVVTGKLASHDNIRSGRSKSARRAASARARSKSPSEPWVPPPGRATKGAKGPTHRLEIHGPHDPLRISDLDTEEEDVVHSQMRNYEHKIDSLLNEVGTLKNEVELQRTIRDMEQKEDLLNASQRALEEQEREILEYKDELSATERENHLLRKSVDYIKEEADITRFHGDSLAQEREKLMKKLIEAEMDGQEAGKQVSELRNTIRALRQENKMTTSDMARLSKQKDMLLEKLADFDATNRTLRRLLRSQHKQEAAALQLSEQRDILMRKLADTDGANERLRLELIDKDRMITDLRCQLGSQKEKIIAMSGMQEAQENTRAHLQKQLRTKEADCNRMAVQIRTLESENAHHKIELEHLKELVAAAKEKADRDKEALKKATRVQKERATRSEDALEQMKVQILERDCRMEDMRSELEQLSAKYDRITKERSQISAENAALNTRLEELESLLDRVDQSSKSQVDELVGKLHEKTGDLSEVKLENDRLRSSIATIETKFKQADEELLQLRANLKHYENLIEEYKEQVKNRLHHRLQELEPLPELLKSSELRLHETEDKVLSYDRKNAENTKLIAELTAKIEHVTQALEQTKEKCHNAQDEQRNMASRCDSLERRLRDSEDKNREMMATLSKREENMHQNSLRLEEKSRENASLTRQLENALTDMRRLQDQNRDAASQKERAMQTRIMDLESQLSQTRAEIARVKREKEENERKFNSRLYDLKDRLEQSHSTNRSMQNYVQFLKNSYANVFGDSSLGMMPPSAALH
ncbi:hypothetical protein CHS0354_016885 [Potamilus streckersoni]|uniref:Outer dense fiber protein 2 n=1 Tax=Potamilus streckersoni TaxID=2493646 RepID=A0AAE0VR74_9BIVA|nr:hypothetical protein CHS0354_016885 [Potamilus streckersoni]